MTELTALAERARRPRWPVAVVVLAGLHAALVRHTFGWPLVPDILYSRGDFATHAEQVARVLQAWESAGQIWAYDVQLLAGAPNGVFFDADNKVWELWTWVLMACGLDMARAFNSFALMVHVVMPFTVYAGARLFRYERSGAVAASALAMALWWFDSFVRWNWFVGMLCYALSALLALPTLGLFYRWCEERRVAYALGAALSLALCLLVHPYAFFVLVTPMTALYVRAGFRERVMSRRDHVLTFGIALFAIAVNSVWLVTALRYFHYIIDSAYYAQGGATALLTDFLGIATDVDSHGVIGPRTGVRVVALGAAVLGIRSLRAGADPRALVFMAALVPLALVTYLGAYTVAAQVQPYRHAAPLALLAVLPAGPWLLEALSARPLASLPREVRALGLIALLLATQKLASDVLYFFEPDLPLPAHSEGDAPIGALGHGFTHRYTYATDDPSYRIDRWERLIAWIDAHDDGQARWLVDNQVMGEYVMARTRAQVMGGFTVHNIGHSDANWFRHHGSHPPYDVELMRRYLSDYAVRYILVRRVGMRPWWEQQGELFRRVAFVDGVVVYEVVDPSGLLIGEGRAEARINRIDVRGSRPDQDVVLRFHFMETLGCAPDCRLQPEPLAGDRIGFIRVPAPHPPDFAITNRYAPQP